MLTPFHLICSVGAAFLSEKERHDLAVETVKMAEKMKPVDQYCVFNDSSRFLKVIVKLDTQEVWIMSMKEATEGGLPSPIDN